MDKIPINQILKNILVETIDLPILSSNAIVKVNISLVLQMGSHREELLFYLITSPCDLIVLGLALLQAHNPIVYWFKEIPSPSTRRLTTKPSKSRLELLPFSTTGWESWLIR
jgi:hypothetical protein